METNQQNLQPTELLFAPFLAESKNSIIKEVEEKIQEQFSSINTKIETFQNQELLAETTGQRQNVLTDVLKKTFNHKLEQLRLETRNEITSLCIQNQELQNTVNTHVAEIKSQKELIENVRKSFERKLQAKDLLINDLQQKNEQLTIHVNRLERTFDRDIQSLHRAVDCLLAERNTSKIDDLHSIGLPPASPKY